MMRPKINFCTPEYLDLAPCNKELTKYTGRCTTFFLATSLGLFSLPCSLLSWFFSGSAGLHPVSGSSTSRCATKAALTTWLVAARYSNNGSWGLGATNVGTEDKYVFNSCKVASAPGVHCMGSVFFKICKNGRARSADLEMNLLSAVTHPIKRLTSLSVLGA